LLDAGLPLDRFTLHLPTLHPTIFARTIAWAPNEPVEICDRRHGAELSAAFTGSPLRQVMATGRPMLVRSSECPNNAWLELDVFRGGDHRLWRRDPQIHGRRGTRVLSRSNTARQFTAGLDAGP
jgi:hypothetical protein